MLAAARTDVGEQGAPMSTKETDVKRRPLASLGFFALRVVALSLLAAVAFVPLAQAASPIASADPLHASHPDGRDNARAAAGDFRIGTRSGIVTWSYSFEPASVEPHWWGPSALDSPTYAVEVISSSSTTAHWKVIQRWDFSTSDPYPPAVAPRYAPYLAPADDVQSDNPEILALARSLVSGSAWESDAVRAIAMWVRANITYDFTFSLPSDALAVLHNRSGVCTGFSNLSTALLRAAGIPSATAGGWVGPGRGVMPHAWNVVFYPSAGWVYSDPQASLFTISTGHIVPAVPAWGTLFDAATQSYAVGVVANDKVSDFVGSGHTDTYPGAGAGYLDAATVSHSQPTMQAAPQVGIEADPAGPERFEGTQGPDVRASVTGSPHTAWLTWRLDGQDLWSGGLEAGLLRLPAERVIRRLRTLPAGQHTVTLDAEDVWGQHGQASFTIESVVLKLGDPVVPAVMLKGKPTTVYGSLTPRQPAGQHPVRLNLAKHQSDGRWTGEGYVLAPVSDFSSRSRYSASVVFPSRGNWRIRARYSDLSKWSAESAYVYVTVR